MDVKVEKLKKGKEKIIVTVEAIEMVPYFKQSFDKIAPTIKLDGFRPGKAPKKLIESAAGVSRLLSTALDLAISETYSEALKKNGIIPITSPNIVINKYPNYGTTVDEVKDALEYEAEIDVLPEVLLEDYSKASVERGEAKKAKKEEVDKVLEHFQKQNSDFASVDRPAKKGDRIEVTFEGFLKKVRVDQMCSKNHPVILGEGSLIPGFEDQLIGMKVGEKKEFKITFPKDYHAKEYAGKEAEFHVELLDIKEVKLPAIDDKFAEKFGHKSVDDLKKAIEANLNDELAVEYQRELENKVIDKVLPYLKAEVPEALIAQETNRIFSDFSGQIMAQGINVERYLESSKKTPEDLKKEMEPQAEKNVKVGFLLGKVIEKNKLDQSDKNVGRKALDLLIDQVAKK